jgi:hypothetical protein
VTPEHWKRVGELFEAAIEQKPAARAEFLARAEERAKRIHRSHANWGEHLRAPLREVEQRLAIR